MQLGGREGGEKESSQGGDGELGQEKKEREKCARGKEEEKRR